MPTASRRSSRTAESERITPSVILFDGHNAIVGSLAKQNAVAEPEKIVDFVKREMGKSKAQFHREFGEPHLLRGGARRAHHQEAQERRGELPRRAGDRRGDHRARVLQRRRAHGHAARGAARRAERAPGHQRADRRGARLRPRQARPRPDGFRLRSRRRHVRRHDHAHRGAPHPHARLAMATIGSAARIGTTSSSTGWPRNSTRCTARIRCSICRATRISTPARSPRKSSSPRAAKRRSSIPTTARA